MDKRGKEQIKVGCKIFSMNKLLSEGQAVTYPFMKNYEVL